MQSFPNNTETYYKQALEKMLSVERTKRSVPQLDILKAFSSKTILGLTALIFVSFLSMVVIGTDLLSKSLTEETPNEWLVIGTLLFLGLLLAIGFLGLIIANYETLVKPQKPKNRLLQKFQNPFALHSLIFEGGVRLEFQANNQTVKTSWFGKDDETALYEKIAQWQEEAESLGQKLKVELEKKVYAEAKEEKQKAVDKQEKAQSLNHTHGVLKHALNKSSVKHSISVNQPLEQKRFVSVPHRVKKVYITLGLFVSVVFIILILMVFYFYAVHSRYFSLHQEGVHITQKIQNYQNNHNGDSPTPKQINHYFNLQTKNLLPLLTEDGIEIVKGSKDNSRVHSLAGDYKLVIKNQKVYETYNNNLVIVKPLRNFK